MDRCKLRNSYTTVVRKGPPQGDHLEELETREEGEEIRVCLKVSSLLSIRAQEQYRGRKASGPMIQGIPERKGNERMSRHFGTQFQD